MILPPENIQMCFWVFSVKNQAVDYATVYSWSLRTPCGEESSATVTLTFEGPGTGCGRGAPRPAERRTRQALLPRAGLVGRPGGRRHDRKDPEFSACPREKQALPWSSEPGASRLRRLGPQRAVERGGRPCPWPLCPKSAGQSSARAAGSSL